MLEQGGDSSGVVHCGGNIPGIPDVPGAAIAGAATAPGADALAVVAAGAPSIFPGVFPGGQELFSVQVVILLVLVVVWLTFQMFLELPFFLMLVLLVVLLVVLLLLDFSRRCPWTWTFLCCGSWCSS